MLLGSCGNENDETGLKKDTTVLKLAFNQSKNHPQYERMVKFGEKLTEQTDGKYVLDIVATHY